MPKMSTGTPTANVLALPAPKLTTRQTLLLNGLVEGKSMADAANDAGLNRTAAYRSLENMRERVCSVMDEVGLGERDILVRIRELADATKTELAVHKGVFTDTLEVPDFAVRAKAIETAARIRGMLERDSSVSIGTVNITWHGAAPSWANPAAPIAPDASVLLASTVESTANSSDTEITPGISTVEGTGNGTGAPTDTHSGKLVERCSREKKKRKPRLPVYRGDGSGGAR